MARTPWRSKHQESPSPLVKHHQYTERASGMFCRRFTLGAAVDADKITATYKAGVLEVHIPKTAAAQPKRIAVQASS